MPTTKVAVVTASDSGIGKASAIMLAEQGYDIGITGVPTRAARRRRQMRCASWDAAPRWYSWSFPIRSRAASRWKR